MAALTILSLTLSLLAPASGPVSADPLRAAIAAAVAERIGSVRSIDIEVVRGAEAAAGPLSAAPAPGARLGQPARFLITPASGRPFSVIARVRVTAGHAVAARAVARGEQLTAADVHWTEGPIDGQLLQPLPALDEVLGSVARRALAAADVLNAAALAKVPAVRAGDEITITFRSGPVEVRGVARAVSSGAVGDLIRVTTPGSRDIRLARITAPATVEIER
jgi:flagella basal body P-ring formation protein FlgA